MTADQPISVTCTVNGETQTLEVGAGETLLQTLRRRLWLTGTKEGCLEGECGACTVLIDGAPVASCIQSAAAVDGRDIRTIEGLSDGERLSPLQQAFLDHAAVQCGFCIPGMLMTLTALLEQQASPSREEVETALAGNTCRCTGYQQMVDAAMTAAGRERA
ncbi:MAG: (2Fe-2S)-binding protein [Rhodospirillaceae bacterium]|jgi:aerobic carbon-monoxide dehydrogenase small subunit|nr:(2Fe-2S)-binding protein [Rhodospirillaceae bacterium]MBT5191676.1 (2Fe-2S)-binding protein [Rhodospirillaceae bacterium]MBT5895026.1 (2Fe-2S)-binding protein [Rhodospirillaceae bacterium]MBT6430579.1 (2Fe-2S)-binding protein [Rhodospirillaceae bacterium]MBT7758821.1 (2Fe-2S)-binding protein [Rhodospirillaceae bacterium]